MTQVAPDKRLLRDIALTEVYKTADTSRGNTGATSADPDLQARVAPGVYAVETWLYYEATVAADILQTWALSGGAAATMVWAANNLAATATAGQVTGATSRQGLPLITSSNVLGGVGLGTTVEGRPGGTLTVTTAGVFALSWAANVAGSLGDAILHAGSRLQLRKIG